MTVTVTAALMLVLRQYFGKAQDWRIFLLDESANNWKTQLADALYQDTESGLYPLLFWAAGCVLFYLLLPAIVSAFVLKTPLKQSGFNFQVPPQHWKIYRFLLLIVLPFVYIASFSVHFRETYPFYRVTAETYDPGLFVLWEIAYFLQFVSVEYFFRGFLLFHSEKYIGKHGVLLSMLPYCMIHFGKPFPETVGAIIAGIVLGTMALKSRSIIPGILLHYIVAIAMDLLSLSARLHPVD